MKHSMKIMIPFLMIAGLLTGCGSQVTTGSKAETTQATKTETTTAVSEQETADGNRANTRSYRSSRRND